MKKLVFMLLRTYQFGLSPFLGPACRFYPTCSEYAYQAVADHGVGRGLRLAFSRLLRCHPFHPGGVDPVPPNPRSEGKPN